MREAQPPSGGNLPQTADVRSECPLDRLVARGRPRGGVELGRVAAQAERGARLVEAAGAEERGGRGPQRPVAVGLLGPQLASRARSARRGRRRRRRRRGRRSGRARARRGSRRAGAPCPGRRRRRAAPCRSGRGTPRRSSRGRARTAPRRAARRRRTSSRAAPGSRTSRPERDSRPRPPARSPPRRQASKLRNRRDRAVDLLVAVREREEHGLELRGGDVDALREQVAEERRVALGVAALLHVVEVAERAGVGHEERQHRADPLRRCRTSESPASSRAPRRSSSS